MAGIPSMYGIRVRGWHLPYLIIHFLEIQSYCIIALPSICFLLVIRENQPETLRILT
ncbi:hypothetical protein DM02DRAFT_665138 [Periconia macrospinosa]|uniref:Uncharacterized protein n=1 Tax=Periconia macrospinosa TaxID=97972 RepID=A0A2V1CXK6_9PLEO|nr:hypothetical protein DM02DRAFT_665138 [Periconia macrospinosa]